MPSSQKHTKLESSSQTQLVAKKLLKKEIRFALGAKSFITTSDTLRLGLLYMKENKIITIGLSFSPPNLRINIC